MQKSAVFLYTNTKLPEREIKNTVPIKIASKKNKIPKHVFDQGFERTVYWKLQNIHKRNWRRKKQWKDILCWWIGRINIIKMSIPPNAIYSFSAIPINIPMAFCKETEQVILNFETTQNQSWEWKAKLEASCSWF